MQVISSRGPILFRSFANLVPDPSDGVGRHTGSFRITPVENSGLRLVGLQKLDEGFHLALAVSAIKPDLCFRSILAVSL